MGFNYERFSEAIRYQMLSLSFERKSKLGLRDFAPEIGISFPTLSRCSNGAKMDVDTLVLLLKWLGKDFNFFIDK